MSSKQLQIIYGFCAFAGVAATMYFNLQFIDEQGGFSLITFVTDNYVNAASASIANDITVVALVFLIWSYQESKRLAIPHWWLYGVLTFVVAIAFTFPLFLLMRERKLAEEKQHSLKLRNN